MGLIKDTAKAFAGNVVGVAGSVVTSAVSDQYLEFFTCDSLGQDILVREGAIKMEKGRNKGSSEVISNGSIVGGKYTSDDGTVRNDWYCIDYRDDIYYVTADSFEVLTYEVDENDLSGTHISEQLNFQTQAQQLFFNISPLP